MRNTFGSPPWMAPRIIPAAKNPDTLHDSQSWDVSSPEDDPTLGVMWSGKKVKGKRRNISVWEMMLAAGANGIRCNACRDMVSGKYSSDDLQKQINQGNIVVSTVDNGGVAGPMPTVYFAYIYCVTPKTKEDILRERVLAKFNGSGLNGLHFKKVYDNGTGSSAPAKNATMELVAEGKLIEIARKSKNNRISKTYYLPEFAPKEMETV